LRRSYIQIVRDEPIVGVIRNNAIEHLGEVTDGGIWLDWEEHKDACGGICKLCDCNHEDSCRCAEGSIHKYEPSGEHDACEFCGEGDVLIGDWRKDDSGRYVPDEKGYYSAVVGEVYTQVLMSRFTRPCALCSPCYPQQGDLETPGPITAYDLPKEIKG
jgi:hypothetical protein